MILGVKVTLFFSVGCTLLYVMQHKCQETYLCQLAVQIDVFGITSRMILFLEWKTVE